MTAGLIAGKDNMVFKGQVPWHGLGTKIDGDLSLSETLELIKGDYNVVCRPLCTNDDLALNVPTRGLFREDTNDYFATVGPEYTPLQNADAFASFEPIVENGDISVHTAGTLFGGQKCWLLCQTEEGTSEVVKDDPVHQFMLLSNSHDGISSVRVGFTPIRVVCANTLALANGSSSSKMLSIKHHKNIKDNLKAVVEVMNTAKMDFEATIEQYKVLASYNMNSKELLEYVKLVFEVEDINKVGKRTQNQFNDIEALFEYGMGNDLPEARHTMWAAYNAITEFATHRQGNKADKRLDNVWFANQKGRGRNLIQHALNVGLEFVTAA